MDTEDTPGASPDLQRSVGRPAPKRWICNSCRSLLMEDWLLTAPSPFDAEMTLTACPRCKQCDEGFMEVCDEPTCMREAGCGWPTGDNNDQWGGYRRTCYEHSEWKRKTPNV